MLRTLFIFIIFNVIIIPQSDVDSLILLFHHQDPYIRGNAVSKLAALGERPVPLLLKNLQDENETIRWCAALTLQKIAPLGKEAIPYLIKALNDKNSNVKWSAVLALGKYQSDALSAAPVLQKMLYEDDRGLRWAAYISLLRINKNAINIRPELKDLQNLIEKLVPELMDEYKVPGVSVAVIWNKELKWSRCFGSADFETEKEVTPYTIFEACSMSKPVFAFIIMKLVEEGKLDLDMPLYTYLPESFIAEDDDYPKTITARMILTHTSGMPNWRKGGEEINAPLPVYFKPGSKFLYSGEGFYYLQRVIEHITKESLENISRTFFNKLGMNATDFIWSPEVEAHLASGHDSDGCFKEKSKYIHSNAAYSLYTTPEDYAKFIMHFMKSSTTASEMEMVSHQYRSDIRDVIDRPGRNQGLLSFRGLGWAIDSTITGNIIYHSGSNSSGFTCYSQFDISAGTGIVIMTNADRGNELWRRIISEIGDL